MFMALITYNDCCAIKPNQTIRLFNVKPIKQIFSQDFLTMYWWLTGFLCTYMCMSRVAQSATGTV